MHDLTKTRADHAKTGLLMTRLGKYELHEELGRRSVAIVYRATDTVLSREVALKAVALS